LTKKCGSLDSSHFYGIPQPVTWIALPYKKCVKCNGATTYTKYYEIILKHKSVNYNSITKIIRTAGHHNSHLKCPTAVLLLCLFSPHIYTSYSTTVCL
jgi:hypothetical protein